MPRECEQREQGWRSGDCTRLSRTWSVFDLGLAAMSGLSCLLVRYSAPRGFSPGPPVFHSPQKSTFPNSCWRASSFLFSHWDIKTKASQASLVQFSLLSQCENNHELAL